MDTLQIISSRENVFELHLNLWESEKNGLQALDIGLFCPIENESYDLTIVIPEKHEKGDFEDLYKRIIDNEIVCNVFNAYVEITSGKCCSYAKRCEVGNELDFIIFPISCFNYYDNLGKSHLKINVPSRKEIIDGEEDTFAEKINISKYVYCRFRINNVKKYFYSVYSEPINKPFESGYEQNEIIDVRINDAKLLDLGAQKKLITSRTHFSKIHFLLICDFEKNVIQFNKIVKPRLFEKAGWENYLPKPLSQEQRKSNRETLAEQLRPLIVEIKFEGFLMFLINVAELISRKKQVNHTMMAYHMTDKVPKGHDGTDFVKLIDSSSFLLKIQWKKTSKMHLLWYAFIIILLAIGANALWTLIWSFFEMPNIIYVGI